MAVIDGDPPWATTTVELEHPLQDINVGAAPSGELYKTLLVLARLHGDVLAVVQVPLEKGAVSASRLGTLLWQATQSGVNRHVSAYGCSNRDTPTEDDLYRGFGATRHCTSAPESAHLPLVTVVVATAGRSERLRRCVSGLAAMSYPFFEILVVDNAPDDPDTWLVVEQLARAGVPVRYAAEPTAGLSLARNRGINESSAELIAFTDDDVEVDPEWLSWIVERFVDERVGAVTGLVMPARLDTREQWCFEQLGGFGRGTEARRYDAFENQASERLLFPYWGAAFGSGNNMAFRRRVLEQIGGFDPALGPGSPAHNGEDLDAFSRVILQGEQIVYEPRAVCWHDHRAGEAELRAQSFGYAVGCTAVLSKWIMRNPRLLLRLLSLPAGAAVSRFGDRGPSPHGSFELTRLWRQFRVNYREGRLLRQLGGLFVGPLLYLWSLLRVQRLRRRKMLTIVEHTNG